MSYVYYKPGIWPIADALCVYSVVIGRDGEGHDPCDQPGDGDVLGHVTLERHGDHGENIQI